MSSPTVQLQHEYFDRFAESQYADPNERLKASRGQLAKLVHHARSSIPFYASRLEVLFDRNGKIDWDRWSEIPIISRQELVTQRDAMLAPALNGLHRGPIHELSTSGSTGPPVTVRFTQYSNAVLGAALFRAHTWHELDWSKMMLVWLGDDPNIGAAPEGSVGPPWGPGWISDAVGPTVTFNRYAQPRQILEFMAKHKVSYLSARAKGAQYLANEAMRLGIELSLDAVITFGTAIFPDERDDCRRAFGARVIGPYSSKEGQLMAYQCPMGSHLHINEETTLLEVIDEQGERCPPGKIGRVIVTPIFNFAQPLIRYDQGDTAVLGSKCICGRTLQVLDRIAGRTTHLFRFPDGRRVAPTLPFETILQLLSAKYWQLAQVSPFVLELRYVPSTPNAHEIDIPKSSHLEIASIVRARIHPDATVRLKALPDVPRTFGGKYIEYVCELKEG